MKREATVRVAFEVVGESANALDVADRVAHAARSTEVSLRP